MKKLFLLFMICVLTSLNAQNYKVSSQTSKSIETVYKDSKNGISTVYNDLKSTTPQIKNALESLSKELKTTTDSLWLILVKQQLVWSWCFLILIFSSLFNWLLFYKRNFGNYKDCDFHIGLEKSTETINENYREKSVTETNTDILIPKNKSPEWFIYIHLILCLTLSYFSFIHFSDMLTGFINPEFGALKTITEVVKNLK